MSAKTQSRMTGCTLILLGVYSGLSGLPQVGGVLVVAGILVLIAR